MKGSPVSVRLTALRGQHTRRLTAPVLAAGAVTGTSLVFIPADQAPQLEPAAHHAHEDEGARAGEGRASRSAARMQPPSTRGNHRAKFTDLEETDPKPRPELNPLPKPKPATQAEPKGPKKKG